MKLLTEINYKNTVLQKNLFTVHNDRGNQLFFVKFTNGIASQYMDITDRF